MRTFILLAALLVTPAAGQQTATSWSKDLDYLVRELVAKHKNAFHSISKQALDERVTSLKSRLDDLNDSEKTVEFMRLVTLVGDGHTAVRPDFAGFGVLPINVYSFDDGLFIKAAVEEHKGLIGSRVVSIGGKAIPELKTEFAKFISHDNTQSLRNAFQHYVIITEMLRAAGAVDSLGEVKVVLEKEGTKNTVVLTPVSNAVLRKMKWTNASPAKQPLYLQKAGLDHWNDWLPKNKTLYFKYNRCRGNDAFMKLAGGTVGFIKQNDVDRFVLDLRSNPGGNSAIFLPMLYYLKTHKDLNRKGHLFVIIGRRTFSSGLWNAVDMKKKTNALFVGEGTGGKPNHYGEVGTFKLPHSGLTVTYSKKFHRLLPNDDPPSLMPDIPVRFTAGDFFAGRDPYLQAALDYKQD